MRFVSSTAQEAAEDIFFGQVVIIWARWFLVAAGIILALWTSEDAPALMGAIVPVVGIMAMNFYLHGRQLADRPANPALILTASILDLAAVIAVVGIGLNSGEQGLGSNFYVMLYPILLSFAFVMQPRTTFTYTGAALVAYTIACLATQSVQDSADIERLAARLITLTATGLLGAYYWRIHRGRRRAALGVTEMDDVASGS